MEVAVVSRPLVLPPQALWQLASDPERLAGVTAASGLLGLATPVERLRLLLLVAGLPVPPGPDVVTFLRTAPRLGWRITPGNATAPQAGFLYVCRAGAAAPVAAVGVVVKASRDGCWFYAAGMGRERIPSEVVAWWLTYG